MSSQGLLLPSYTRHEPLGFHHYDRDHRTNDTSGGDVHNFLTYKILSSFANILAGILCLSAAINNAYVYEISMRIVSIVVILGFSGILILVLEILPQWNTLKAHLPHLGTLKGRSFHYLCMGILASDTAQAKKNKESFLIWNWVNAATLVGLAVVYGLVAVIVRHGSTESLQPSAEKNQNAAHHKYQSVSNHYTSYNQVFSERQTKSSQMQELPLALNYQSNRPVSLMSDETFAPVNTYHKYIPTQCDMMDPQTLVGNGESVDPLNKSSTWDRIPLSKPDLTVSHHNVDTTISKHLSLASSSNDCEKGSGGTISRGLPYEIYDAIVSKQATVIPEADMSEVGASKEHYNPSRKSSRRKRSQKVYMPSIGLTIDLSSESEPSDTEEEESNECQLKDKDTAQDVDDRSLYSVASIDSSSHANATKPCFSNTLSAQPSRLGGHMMRKNTKESHQRKLQRGLQRALSRKSESENGHCLLESKDPSSNMANTLEES